MPVALETVPRARLLALEAATGVPRAHCLLLEVFIAVCIVATVMFRLQLSAALFNRCVVALMPLQYANLCSTACNLKYIDLAGCIRSCWTHANRSQGPRAPAVLEIRPAFESGQKKHGQEVDVVWVSNLLHWEVKCTA